MLQIIIPVLIGAVIAAIIAGFIAHSAGRSYERKQYDSKVGSAEEKAREIIDEALKTAETKKREALLEAKEESLKTKNELEKETKERRAELQRYEKRVLSNEEKRQMPLKRRRLIWSEGKIFSVNVPQRWKPSMSREYRNWNEFPVLPPNRQKNIF